MSSSQVGLDIGSTSVRAVRVKHVDSDGFAVIDRFAVVPMRGDAVVAGSIRDAQTLAAAVEQALKAVGAKGCVIASGVAVPQLAVSRLALPAVIRPEERLRAVRTMNVPISPAIPMMESALAANFVREEVGPDSRALAAIIVAATIQRDVTALDDVVRMAGFRLNGIDLSAMGTLRALVRDVEGSHDVSCVVDVGATSTTVITREGLLVRSIRLFPSGGMDITRAIAQSSKETFDDAERRKYSMHLPVAAASGPLDIADGYGGVEDTEDEYLARLAKQSALEQAVANAAEHLVDQIAQAIETDVDATGQAVRHVALCGGTALMRGLKERLQRRVGAEVRIGHPWARLVNSKEHEQHFHNGREDPRLMLSLATATGLALWRDTR